ncbi:MAG TPA: class I SAM-dependent methyltransferase [Mycobacteriales bacterium]|nr:class I SAM-dependent methyltransferase [Mycobacteriales bacterium]
MNPQLDPVIHSFYAERFREDERLTRSRHGQLEFLRTQELLRRHLPAPPARVLDVGGATGVHARWLAADGFSVHLVDPVPSHVEQAAAIGGFTAEVGDARALAEADGGADVTLLLGPLYHLVAAEDRRRALGEARRVTRRGGLVVAAAVSRYAGLLEFAGLGLLTESTQGEFLDHLATGIHHDDPNGFTNAYFHRAAELQQEMLDAGLADVTVFGVEGPTTAALDNAAPERADAVLAAAVRCARILESDPAVMETSQHFLAFGYSR